LIAYNIAKQRFYSVCFQKLIHMIRLIIFFLFTTIMFISCNKETSDWNSPVLSYLYNEGDTMSIQSSNKSVNIVFNFSDKDGDLGNDISKGRYDIYTVDNRNNDTVAYMLPDELRKKYDTQYGISGTCVLTIIPSFYELRPSHPLDTMKLTIFMLDRGGAMSNLITTSTIYVTP
jgi:hypothetical protein